MSDHNRILRYRTIHYSFYFTPNEWFRWGDGSGSVGGGSVGGGVKMVWMILQNPAHSTANATTRRLDSDRGGIVVATVVGVIVAFACAGRTEQSRCCFCTVETNRALFATSTKDKGSSGALTEATRLAWQTSGSLR